MATEIVTVPIEVAPGEFFDRLTITYLKCEHAVGPQAEVLLAQKANFDRLQGQHFPPSPELDRLVGALQDQNRQLWDLETKVRGFSQPLEAGSVSAFASVARAIFVQNEERAMLKRQIDLLFQPASGEAKIYDTGGKPDA